MKKLKKAIELASWFYQGRKDLGGEPYFLHPLRVMLSLENEPEAQVVAILHDMLEDGSHEVELREIGLSKKEMDAIELLTRKPGQSYSDYVIYLSVNRLASLVKIADLKDNLNKDRIAQLLFQGDDVGSTMRRVAKYRKALELLEAKWVERP